MAPVLQTCPVSRVTRLMGEKMGFVVLEQIELHGQEGFNALIKRLKKVRSKLLARRLQQLEQEGLVTKFTSSQKKPYRSMYTITQKGKVFLELIKKIKEWKDYYSEDKPACKGKECPNCALY